MHDPVICRLDHLGGRLDGYAQILRSKLIADNRANVFVSVPAVFLLRSPVK